MMDWVLKLFMTHIFKQECSKMLLRIRRNLILFKMKFIIIFLFLFFPLFLFFQLACTVVHFIIIFLKIIKMQVQICQFYVARKKRQCKFPAIKGSKYCNSHCSDIQGKIQCPFQKGVYIDINKYQRHIENCPRIKQKKKVQDNIWFNKGINKQQAIKQQKKEKIEIDEIAYLSGVEDHKINQLIPKIVQTYLSHFNADKSKKFIQTTELEDLSKQLQQITNDHKQAYLIAKIANNYNLIGDKYIYVQFGAGKGILSYAIAKFLQKNYHQQSKNILLERQTRRNKFDRYFRDNPYFQRYKTDISDFDMKNAPKIMSQWIKDRQQKQKKYKNVEFNYQEIQKKLQDHQIVGICKHMCGEALDISIRGMIQTKYNGCILASCCHHLCSLKTYVNLQFFYNSKLVDEQINILFKLSSWGTRSLTIMQDQIDFKDIITKNIHTLNQKQKTIIGRMCKRLIDLGRTQFLKGNLQRYCSDQLTPQNFVIICKH